MDDIQSQLRVIEMLHVIKNFIMATKRLMPEDIKTLELIANVMEKEGKTKSSAKEMTMDEIENALGHPVKIVKEKSHADKV